MSNRYVIEWDDLWVASTGFMGSEESRTSRIDYAQVFHRREDASARIEEIRKAVKCENIKIKLL